MAVQPEAEASTDADCGYTGPIITVEDGALILTWPKGKPREFACTPEALEGIVAERNRFREHSVRLNSVGWRIAAALGKVTEVDETYEGNVETDLAELIDWVENGKPL